jgi:hypothetical protein
LFVLVGRIGGASDSAERVGVDAVLTTSVLQQIEP